MSHAPKVDRDLGVDALRGVAVLGLMAAHATVFSRPIDLMMSPAAGLEYEGWNEVFIWLTQVLVFGKFMFLFALLFGASVIYFDRKIAGARLADGAGLWFSRMGWLAAIGFLHGTLLFFGDILLLYAICGAAGVWWVRRMRLLWLFVIGAGGYLFGLIMLLGSVLLQAVFMSDEAAAGNFLYDMMTPEAQTAAALGSWLDATRTRVLLFLMQTMNAPFMTFWLTSGIMCFGIALARMGVLTGERSRSFYALLLIGGAAVGLPLSAAMFGYAASTDFAPVPTSLWVGLAQLLGMPLSLAYLGGIMLIAKSAPLRPIATIFAAVGRMALSNYLLHSLLANILFLGWGLGWFGRFEYPELAVIVVAVWTLNILFSVLWLQAFRFGPVEWLWRSLTYRRRQPLLRDAMK